MKNQVNRRIFLNTWICLLAFLGVGVWLSGCAPATEIATIEPVVTQPVESTSTPTVVWFPATATSTLPPVDTATPDPAATPILGSLIFSDPFTGNDPWQNEQNATGYVIVKDGTLTLAVKSTRGSLVSFRNNTQLTNFYLETTATVGLCKDDDQIGVLFRVNGSQSFYRFLLNCQGQVSLQQVAGGTPVVLVDWTPGNVSPGLYQPITIGIWQSGSKIRVYMNNGLLFEATSDYFKSGGIGFYAHAAGENALTVNFTSLNVFDVPRLNALTPTP